MPKCIICGKTTKPNNHVSCVECMKAFHHECLDETIDITKIDVDTWNCSSCAVQESTRTNKMLQQIIDENKETKKSLNDIHNKLDDQKNSMEDLTAKLRDALEEIDTIKTANATLINENLKLRGRITQLEQDALANSLDIVGVPENKGENLHAVLGEIGRGLGLELSPEKIDTCYRVGAKHLKNRGIAVKFVKNADREKVLEGRRV